MLDKPISPLRQRMIDDMTARRFNEHTQMDYVRRVRSSAAFLGRSPDAATSEDVRRYQLQMAKEQSDKAGCEKLPPPRSPRLRLSESHAPPTTPTERLLCRAFQQTLGLKEVSIDGDFFNEYGAHSLLMARFCARIRQLSPATRVAMRDVYANPNIRRLARAIDSAKLPTPPTRDIGPEHRPTLAAYYGCGLAQTVVYLLAGAIGVWILQLGLEWTYAAVHSPPMLYGRALAIVSAWFFGHNGARDRGEMVASLARPAAGHRALEPCLSPLLGRQARGALGTRLSRSQLSKALRKKSSAGGGRGTR